MMDGALEHLLCDALARGVSARLRLSDEGEETVLVLRLAADAAETAWAVPLTAEEGLEGALAEVLRIGIQQIADVSRLDGPAPALRARPLPLPSSFAAQTAQ
jgi:hypothetical protein